MHNMSYYYDEQMDSYLGRHPNNYIAWITFRKVGTRVFCHTQKDRERTIIACFKVKKSL
jgi:hypothetical protein